MAFDVVKITQDSFVALYQNKAVLITGMAFGVLSAIFGGFIAVWLIPQFMQLQSQIGNLQNPSPAAVWQAISSFLPVLGPALGLIAGGGLVIYLVNILVRGVVISAVYAGEKNKLNIAVNQALSRYLWLLITYIALAILVFLGLILLVIPGIYIGVKLSMAPVETLVGKKGVVESLKSSWAKTEGRWWSVFFTLLLVVVLTVVLSLILGVVFGFLGLIGGAVIAIVGSLIKLAVTVARTKIYQELSPDGARRTRTR